MMSVLYCGNKEDGGVVKPYRIASDIFKITNSFKKLDVKRNLKRKLKDHDNEAQRFSQLIQTVDHVKEAYQVLQAEIQSLLCSPVGPDQQTKNDSAVKLAKKVYDESGRACLTNTVGENKDQAKRITINNHRYLFPANCKFYCKDVAEIQQYLIDVKYHLIVLDPPWWNKYVRRKRAKTDHGYEMMYNDDLKAIPIENLLEDNGLVVVWCTNSVQHLQTLQDSIFPKWKVDFIGKWYWLKITQSGEPVCGFSEPPGKQPFEQIIFGYRNPQQLIKPEDGKLIVSVPSALHSHKPPLIELLQPYLPDKPKCLELFARYLLPDWTSWGREAARFQHESLYESVGY